MRVLFFPHMEGNPYQEKLAAGLSEAGVDVSLASGYPVSTIRTFLRTRPNVIHVHWIAPYLVNERLSISLVKSMVFLQATLVAKLLGTDIVWTVHNVLDHERRQPDLELTVRQIYARLVDAIIVHCSAAEETVVRRYNLPSKAKTFVVPHGHYDDSYENTVSQRQARDRLGLDQDVTTFLYFGRIRPYKQVPRLVEEFAGMEGEDIRLVVAGNPTDETEVQRMQLTCREDDRITTRFEFIADEEMQVYLNAANAIVLPYRDILTSGSAILGMSFRKPIIGPCVGCLPELLDEQPELLYDPDVDSLADAMGQGRTADLDAIGERNRQRILEFEWDEIGSATGAVYDQL